MKTVFSEEYQRLINALISARKDGGVLQVDIDKKLGKPQSFVAKYEGCERRLDIVELIAVCRAMNVNPVTILKQAGLVSKEDCRDA